MIRRRSQTASVYPCSTSSSNRSSGLLMLMLMLHNAIALLLMPIRSQICSARREAVRS